jgi:protein SCO1/2
MFSRIVRFRAKSLRRLLSSEGPQAPKTGVPRGPVTYATLSLFALAAGGVTFYYQVEKEKKAQRVASETVTTGKAALGGPWVLVDHDGLPRTDASYRGKFTLLYFGFSYCPDICPSELVKIGKVMDEMTKLNKGRSCPIQTLFISVDPLRDTVGQLKHYSQDFHPEIRYLTGTKEQIAKATKSYRVYFSKANENIDDADDYLVDHSIVFYLLSPEGEFLDFFTQRTQVLDIVERISLRMKERAASPKVVTK